MDPINDFNAATGGNPQQNPEPAPNAAMNFSDAGNALLEMLNSAGVEPPATEPPADPNYVDLSTVAPDGGNTGNEPAPVPVQPQPAFDPNLLEDIKNTILSEIQSLKNSNQPQQDPTATGPVEPENQMPEIDSEAFMEQFSKDPVKAVHDLAEKIADQKVAASLKELEKKMQPLVEQSEKIAEDNARMERVKNVLTEFVSDKDYADADKYFPQIAEAIKTEGLPEDDIRTYMKLYQRFALADAMANQGKTLDDYLADENELQKIIGNPKIKDAVITAYLAELASNGKPMVISGSGNVLPPATPPTRITDFKEASNILKSQL